MMILRFAGILMFLTGLVCLLSGDMRDAGQYGMIGLLCIAVAPLRERL